MLIRTIQRGLLAAALSLAALPAGAQEARVATTTAERPELKGPDFTGIYQLAPNGVALPGGLRSQGSPEEIPLQPSAQATARSRTSRGWRS